MGGGGGGERERKKKSLTPPLDPTLLPDHLSMDCRPTLIAATVGKSLRRQGRYQHFLLLSPEAISLAPKPSWAIVPTLAEHCLEPSCITRLPAEPVCVTLCQTVWGAMHVQPGVKSAPCHPPASCQRQHLAAYKHTQKKKTTQKGRRTGQGVDYGGWKVNSGIFTHEICDT